ncbi:cadherin EGF LAG seven-pass G-type receptor 2 isoform X1 [Brachionus plicatilis]|uniref:Cadherin EGF LAG seven-pass G-type receptor 2 isoform X1 n=1 Tax=Brachionus plicatilis TaxID=10195 RepID=A0A3M7PEQ0_BRAPC|nr:cadherin EGF LAG seven-pass G-type receptor 2 isoform X1 [Brachionus plicatilis]
MTFTPVPLKYNKNQSNSKAVLTLGGRTVFLISLNSITNVHLFNLAGQSTGFNLSLSVSYDLEKDKFVPSSILKQILYSNMDRIKSLLRVKKVLIYEDKSCSIEPCLNYQKCQTVSKFSSADSNYQSSSRIQFRSVRIRHDFSCSCPLGFTGNISVMCDTEINLCYSNPCGQNGICISTESSYVCTCDPGYTGRTCEIDIKNSKCSQLSPFGSGSFMNPALCKGSSVCKNLILGGFVCDECSNKDQPSASKYYTHLCEVRAVNFPEKSGAYIVLVGLENRIRFKLKLTFSTIHSNGVLFYNGRLEDNLDFVSLVIENDFLTFKFSLGDSVHEVKITEVSVSDAKWRTVTIEYKSRSVYLSLDNDNLENVDSCELAQNTECIRKVHVYNLPAKCQSQIESCSRFFDLNGPLIIGQEASKKNSFQGCISDLYLNERLIDLHHDSLASYGTEHGCSPKTNICKLDGTKFGKQCSKCAHIWSGSVKCDCLSGDFDGHQCAKKKSAEPALSTQTNSYLLFQEKVLESETSVDISMDLRLRPTSDLSNQTIVYVKFSDNLVFNEFFVYYDPVPKSLILISQNIRSHIRLEINKNELFGHQYWSSVLLSFNSDGHVTLSLDKIFTKTHQSPQIKNLFEQKFNYRWSIGAYKTPSLHPSTGVFACIKNIHLNQESVSPYEAFNVSKGCHVSQTCDKLAQSVYFGNSSCLDSCPAWACHNSGNCTIVDNDYQCTCPQGFKGKYCQFKKQQITLANYSCPARWWGIEPGICGPCACDESKNFSPDCDKKSGKCECKPKFYKRLNKVSGEEECAPCDCYLDGSSSLECEAFTGQCKCLPGAGITGRKCDRCVSPFAELTIKGNECRQITSDKCPKAYAFNSWWPRSQFNSMANSSCPKGAVGTAYRSCTPTGWMSSIDLSECRSLNLDSLNSPDSVANSYQAFKLVEELNTICTKSEADDDSDLTALENANLLSTGLHSLYALDLLAIRNVTKSILEYEINNTALFIQDKFFINKIFYIIDKILSKKYELKINQFNYKTNNEFGQWSDLLVRISEFISVLVKNGHEYALSDKLVLNYENLEFGQNVNSKSGTGFELEPGVKFAFSSMNVASYNLPTHLSLKHGSVSTSTYRVVSNLYILATDRQFKKFKVEFLLSNNYDVVYDPLKNHLSYNNLRNSKSDYICVQLNGDYGIWSSVGAKFVSYKPDSNVVTCQFESNDGIFAVITPVGTFVRDKNSVLSFTIGFSILVGLSLVVLSISMILIILIKGVCLFEIRDTSVTN